jgi:sec-independent protein translocase protein TatA
MLGNLTGIHLIIILGVVVLLFGATRLPALSKGIAQSMKIFRNELGSKDKTTETTTTADPTVSTGTPVAHSTTVVNPDGSTTTTTTTTSASTDVPPRV